MNSTKKFSLTRIASATGIALGAFAISVLAQSTWVAPPGAPTTCPEGYSGCDAPLHVGIEHQIKKGPLSINTNTTNPIDPYGLEVFGISRFFGNIEIGTAEESATVKIIDGNLFESGLKFSCSNNLTILQSNNGYYH